MSAALKVELQKVIVTFESKIYKDPGIATNNFQGNIDSCNVAKGTIGNFLVKALLKDQEKYTNYRYECPQKKGFYYWHSFPVPDDTVLPPFIPKFYVLWNLEVKGKGKTSKSAFKLLFRARFRGETVKD